jgi:hypothetical protein
MKYSFTVLAILVLFSSAFAEQTMTVHGDVVYYDIVDDFTDRMSEAIGAPEDSEGKLFGFWTNGGYVSLRYRFGIFLDQGPATLILRMNKGQVDTIQCVVPETLRDVYSSPEEKSKVIGLLKKLVELDKLSNSLVVDSENLDVTIAAMVVGQQRTMAKFSMKGISEAVEASFFFKEAVYGREDVDRTEK